MTRLLRHCHLGCGEALSSHWWRMLMLKYREQVPFGRVATAEKFLKKRNSGNVK